MATEKQIEANRRNAKRSTGPRTAAGKAISSRNSLRHGLSRQPQTDNDARAKLDTLACAINGNEQDSARIEIATEVAAAYLEIGRVQDVRATILATMDIATASLADLQRLLAIDRYEIRARTRRRRAATKFRNFPGT